MAGRKMRAKAAIVISMGVALSGLEAPVAADGLSCGQHVTSSIRLRDDVGPCATGLVITGDEVTLDLDGHRIFGSTSTGDGAGVLFQRTFRSTVRNGTITGFDAGVVIDGGGQNAVKRIKAFGNVGGPALGDGILVMGSGDNLLKRNDVFLNGPLSGISIFAPNVDPLDPSSPRRTAIGNAIIDNNIHDNNLPIRATEMDDAGIRLEVATSHTSVRDNRIAYNGIDGIVIFGGSVDNVVSENRLVANGHHDRSHRRGDGIRVFGDGVAGRSIISHNNLKRNAGYGIALGAQAFGNVIKRNEARGNGVGGYLAPSPTCTANTWRRNAGRGYVPPCTRGRR